MWDSIEHLTKLLTWLQWSIAGAGALTAVLTVAALVVSNRRDHAKDSAAKAAQEEAQQREAQIKAELEKARDDVGTTQNQLSAANETITELEAAQAEFTLAAKTIKSLELYVSIDAITATSPTTEAQTSVGLLSAVALFSKDKNRYRLVTDYKFSREQRTPNVHRISFVYRAETPTQVLGHQIDLLRQMEKLAVDYSTFFKEIPFDPGPHPTRLHLVVLLNGVEVVNLSEQEAGPGVLASGMATLDVARVFEQIPETYSQKIKQKARSE